MESGEPSALRRWLTALLTVRSARDLPKEAWPLLNELRNRESAEKPFAHAADLSRCNGEWIADRSRIAVAGRHHASM
jgi:hypothetical protein